MAVGAMAGCDVVALGLDNKAAVVDAVEKVAVAIGALRKHTSTMSIVLICIETLRPRNGNNLAVCKFVVGMGRHRRRIPFSRHTQERIHRPDQKVNNAAERHRVATAIPLPVLQRLERDPRGVLRHND